MRGSLVVAVLSCLATLSVVADRADGDEALDRAAIDCALATPGHDYVGGDFLRHAEAAVIWAECTVGSRFDLEERLQDVIDRATPGSDTHKRLKRELRLTRKHLRGVALVVDAGSELGAAQPGTDGFTQAKRLAKLLRRMHIASYGVARPRDRSSQEIYSHIAQAAALFRVGVERDFDEQFDRLASLDDERTEKLRKKGQKLAIVATGVGLDLDAIEPDVLSAIQTANAADPFAPDLDPTERRARRLIVRTLGKVVGRYQSGIKTLLVLNEKLRRLVEKAEKLAAEPLEPRGLDEKCTLTDKRVREIGGGWCTVARDGGPEVVYKGQTDITYGVYATPASREFYFGNESEFVRGRPYLKISMEGDRFARPGRHEITGFVEDDEFGIRRDFLMAQLFNRPEGGGNVAYNATEGTVTIDRIRIDTKKGKRIIEGSYAFMAETAGGSFQTYVEGRFHLCKFLIFVQDEREAHFE